MSKVLFDQFQKVTAKEWKQHIQMELKGADFNEKLVTKTWEGIDIKPFYHKDETSVVSGAIPSNGWLISERIFFLSAPETLATILDDCARGAEHIWLVVTEINSDISQMLQHDDFPQVPVFIEFQCLDFPVIQEALKFAEASSSPFEVGVDILGKLASTGNWFTNKEKDIETLGELFSAPENSPSILVDARIYQEAGGTQVQQIAYALAHLNEYLEHLPKLSEKAISNYRIKLIASIGNNYFFEIAKLKALRWAFQSLLEGLDVKATIQITAIPSLRNKTLYDYNINMLRTSTEIMSGVLGGADQITNLAYDYLFQESNEFGKRIARNQLLLLKNEAHLDKVENASDGAYYIESLIEQIASKSLRLFKQIEAGGGFIQQLFDGKIQEKLKQSAQKENEQVNEGKRILVGTTKYTDNTDKMLANLQKDPFKPFGKRKTLLQPIVNKRLTQAIEKERLQKEKAELS